MIKTSLIIFSLIAAFSSTANGYEYGQKYALSVEDDSGEVVLSGTFLDSPNEHSFKVSKPIPYVSLCLANGTKVEETRSQKDAEADVDTSGSIDRQVRLLIDVSIPEFSKVDIGGCDIMVPAYRRLKVDTTLPFVKYFEKFEIKDKDGKGTGKFYYVRAREIR